MVSDRQSSFAVRLAGRTGLFGCMLGLLLGSLAGIASAEEHPQWVPISHDVTAKVKPGYPGKTAGVAVDPATGDVFMVVPDQGIWKSADHGKSFERVDGGRVSGRCETGFALDVDAAGRRLMCFMIYGSSAGTSDGGKTWNASKTTHLDFGAVDWEAGGKCLVALRHESDGQLCYSDDEAQTWTNLDQGFVAVGIFDQHTIVGSRGKGLDTQRRRRQDVESGFRHRTGRSRDAACTAESATGPPTGDCWSAATAARRGPWKACPSAAVFGPLFGRNPLHLVVVGKQGFQETLDGGKTWQVVGAATGRFPCRHRRTKLCLGPGGEHFLRIVHGQGHPQIRAS